MGVTFKIENGREFERMLNKIKDLKRTSTASSTIYSAINSASKPLTSNVKSNTPVAEKDSSGWRLNSRNHNAGTLRDSVKFGLRRRVKGRNIFMGAISFTSSYEQYYAGFVLNTHSPNAFGYIGGNNFFRKSIDQSRETVLNKLEKDLHIKLTKKLQKIIDKV